LNVVAANKQRRGLIPTHKNNPPNSKRSLKGSLWRGDTARQDAVFFDGLFAVTDSITDKREFSGVDFGKKEGGISTKIGEQP